MRNPILGSTDLPSRRLLRHFRYVTPPRHTIMEITFWRVPVAVAVILDSEFCSRWGLGRVG